MNKISILCVGFLSAFAASVLIAGTAQAGCYGTLCAEMVSVGGNGSPAVATVTNGSDVVQLFTFSSYKQFFARLQTGWLSTQVLFDTTSVNLAPKETRQISVNTAGCLTQSDLYFGAGVTSFSDDNATNVGINLLAAGESNDTNLCVKAPTCTSDCSFGQRECSGANSYKLCSMGSDGCYHWNQTNCGSNQTCSGGYCGNTCQDACSFGAYQCSGSSVKICGKYDNSGCTTWGSNQSCDSRCFTCGDSKCECGETKSSCPQDCGSNTPTVDLRSSGSVTCDKNATLTWSTANATSCTASGSWSGSKLTSGSESVGDFTGSRTFTLTCTNGSDSAFDSVNLNGSKDNLNVSAGTDKTLDRSDDSVRLNGSVDGDYDSLSWSCTGGSLSDYHTLQPTFRAPFNDYDYDKTYTCTLTARNECGSDSDSVNISVNRGNEPSDFGVALVARPKSDCAPFNNVDLVATLSNYGSGNYDYTYYFDCENDGDWDKTVTTSNTTYTVVDLCDYANVGSYTAKVKVTSNSRTATDTDIVRATECGREIVNFGQVNINKTVKNVTRGTNYLGTVVANPLDIVSYKIIVGGVSGISDNVLVSDAIPAGITNVRDLEVDGYPIVDSNIIANINLGRLTAGQTKIITYTGTVAGETNFAFGPTTMTNVATVRVNGSAANSTAAVTVYRQAVLGATTISTGFDGDMLAGLGVALLAAIGCLIWVSKNRIAGLFKKNNI
jgi:hypothetical protein